MIRRTKQELGAIASTMWRDAKTAGETDGKTMLAVMCKNGFLYQIKTLFADFTFILPVKADTGARRHLNEEQVIAQMRTVISAGYETVSAVAAVSSNIVYLQSCLLIEYSGYYMNSPKIKRSRPSFAKRSLQ